MWHKSTHSQAQFLVCLAVFLTVSTPCTGQEIAVEEGSVLQAEQLVKLRASPPDKKFLFFVGGPGEELGTIKSGETLTVESTRRVEAPFRQDVWVKVRTERGNVGWAYYGTAKSGNFKLAK